jgi:hypothetical protein
VLENSGPAGNLDFMRRNFPNFIFSPSFRKFCFSSQYLAMHVDGIWSVSSSIGYQALLLNKRFGTTPTSCLNTLAHDTDLNSFFSRITDRQQPDDRLPFLAWYIENYTVPEVLYSQGPWLYDYLTRRVHAIRTAATPWEGFVPIVHADVLRDLWISPSEDSLPVQWDGNEQNVLKREIAVKNVELAQYQGLSATTVDYEPSRMGDGRGSYLLLNETSSIENSIHLGCNAVALYVKEQMAALGFDFLGAANNLDECRTLAEHRDFWKVRLIVLNGEGSAHHDNDRIRGLMQFCREMKERSIRCVLINSVWHENSNALGELLDSFDIVSVRESNSVQEITPWRPDVRLVPDISFAAFGQNTLAFRDSQNTQPPTHQFVVIDSVKKPVATALKDFSEFHGFPFYLMGPSNVEKMIRRAGGCFDVDGQIYPRILRNPDELLSADACLTGRFHALVAALCKGLPVIAVPSNTPKIEGLLKDAGITDAVLLEEGWISLGHYKQLDLLQNMLSKWDDNVRAAVAHYVDGAKHSITNLFNDIGMLVPLSDQTLHHACVACELTFVKEHAERERGLLKQVIDVKQELFFAEKELFIQEKRLLHEFAQREEELNGQLQNSQQALLNLHKTLVEREQELNRQLQDSQQALLNLQDTLVQRDDFISELQAEHLKTEQMERDKYVETINMSHEMQRHIDQLNAENNAFRKELSTCNEHATRTQGYLSDLVSGLQQISVSPDAASVNCDSLPGYLSDVHSSHVAVTLDELLQYHDKQFISCAYQTLLGRTPDPEGLQYYLDRLRSGISKYEILAQLRFSKEGKTC